MDSDYTCLKRNNIAANKKTDIQLVYMKSENEMQGIKLLYSGCSKQGPSAHFSQSKEQLHA